MESRATGRIPLKYGGVGKNWPGEDNCLCSKMTYKKISLLPDRHVAQKEYNAARVMSFFRAKALYATRLLLSGKRIFGPDFCAYFKGQTRSCLPSEP